MPKKCPPGVFCIENVTLFYLFLLIGLALFVFFKYVNPNPNVILLQQIRDKIGNPNIFNLGSVRTPESVLLDPHTPPLKSNGYHAPNNRDIRGVPINVKTRGYDDSYRQAGILTRNGEKETILPLMGRPLHSNRGKWQYYTMNDKNNAIKLPVSKNGKSCTSEYGCDDLFNGDVVYVEGYNDAFKVTIYENSQPRYIPFL